MALVLNQGKVMKDGGSKDDWKKKEGKLGSLKKRTGPFFRLGNVRLRNGEGKVKLKKKREEKGRKLSLTRRHALPAGFFLDSARASLPAGASRQRI